MISAGPNARRRRDAARLAFVAGVAASEPECYRSPIEQFWAKRFASYSCVAEEIGRARSAATSFRLPKFAIVSGAGWCLDIIIFLTLVQLRVHVFLANMIGAALAVTFVFVVSQRSIFIVRRKRIIWAFIAYLGWHAVMITLASLAIAWLSAAISSCSGWVPALAVPLCATVSAHWLAAASAKCLVTPLTLYANFVFSSWIIEARASWR
jgi:putative flippase GtrA